jgi:hypothetical protein
VTIAKSTPAVIVRAATGAEREDPLGIVCATYDPSWRGTLAV